MLSSGRIKLGEVYLSGINGLKGERVSDTLRIPSLKDGLLSYAPTDKQAELFSHCYLPCMLGIRLGR